MKMKTEWRSRLRSIPALPDDSIELGRVSGVFGIHGELRLHLENRQSDLMAHGLDVLFQDEAGRSFRGHIRTRPGTNGRVLAAVRGIDDREAAEGMVGVRLHISRDQLPGLADDEYYLADLVGMQVRCGDRDLGDVVAVHDHGPVGVIELDGQRYLPSTAEHIESIDLEAGVLYVAEGAVAV